MLGSLSEIEMSLLHGAQVTVVSPYALNVSTLVHYKVE